MAQHLEQKSTQEAPRFDYAEFICNPCNRSISISIEGALLLADDKSVQCPLCNVPIKAMPYDQARLRQVNESVGNSDGAKTSFLMMWFIVSLLVALFINTQLSVIMTGVGLFFSYVFNKKTPVSDKPINLDRETSRAVSPGA